MIKNIKKITAATFTFTPLVYLGYVVTLILLSNYLPPEAGIEVEDAFSLPALLIFFEIVASIAFARYSE